MWCITDQQSGVIKIRGKRQNFLRYPDNPKRATRPRASIIIRYYEQGSSFFFLLFDIILFESGTTGSKDPKTKVGDEFFKEPQFSGLEETTQLFREDIVVS